MFSKFIYKLLTFKVIVYFILFIFLGFYAWLITAGSFNFHFKDFGNSGYVGYHHLVDGLLDGKTSLLPEPRPELETLSDPYDPVQNRAYRWHDATYYKGKYFKDIPNWMLLISIILVGLTNDGPTLTDSYSLGVGVYNVSTTGRTFF